MGGSAKPGVLTPSLRPCTNGVDVITARHGGPASLAVSQCGSTNTIQSIQRGLEPVNTSTTAPQDSDQSRHSPQAELKRPPQWRSPTLQRMRAGAIRSTSPPCTTRHQALSVQVPPAPGSPAGLCGYSAPCTVAGAGRAAAKFDGRNMAATEGQGLNHHRALIEIHRSSVTMDSPSPLCLFMTSLGRIPPWLCQAPDNDIWGWQLLLP